MRITHCVKTEKHVCVKGRGKQIRKCRRDASGNKNIVWNSPGQNVKSSKLCLCSGNIKEFCNIELYYRALQ